VELEADGVYVRPDFTVDLAVYQWDPDPLEWRDQTAVCGETTADT
jgi:hypothetical protein